MKFDIRLRGADGLRAALGALSQRRADAALATALTRTAVAVRREMGADMHLALDRPTPYTARQLRYVAATADRPVAGVGFGIEAIQDVRGQVVRYADMGPGSTPADRYLRFQTQGGQRAAKRFELALQAKGAMPRGWVAVPGAGARLDAYGNMTRGQIAQIVAQLGTELLTGYTNTIRRTGAAGVRAKIAQQRRAGGQFFAVLPGSKLKLKPGIYQREFAGRNITPVLIFVPRAAYAPRWDFEGRAAQVADRVLPEQMERAVRESLQRAATGGRA